MIGAALYQKVLELAVRVARGEDPPPPPAVLRVDETASLPESFIPDPTVRINLYARLARVASSSDVDALEDEIADRFGPPPREVLQLLHLTRMAALASEAGVTQISTGPKATAFTLTRATAKRLQAGASKDAFGRWADDRLVFDIGDQPPHDDDFIASVLSRLAA